MTGAESTPGPIAINVATYVGFKKKGFLGSLFATLGVALPSIVIIFAISFVLDMFMSNVWVQYAFNGIKVAVAFLIVRAGYNMIKKLEKKIIPIISFSVVLVLVIVFEICSISFSSIFYILAGGLVGIFGIFEVTSGTSQIITACAAIISLMFVIPFIVCYFADIIMRKKGWLKDGDLKI